MCVGSPCLQTFREPPAPPARAHSAVCDSHRGSVWFPQRECVDPTQGPVAVPQQHYGVFKQQNMPAGNTRKTRFRPRTGSPRLRSGRYLGKWKPRPSGCLGTPKRPENTKNQSKNGRNGRFGPGPPVGPRYGAALRCALQCSLHWLALLLMWLPNRLNCL